jgi:glycerol-3-phosphate O-acyltransferase/dihydroxyacetone phosphate acyltransferase
MIYSLLRAIAGVALRWFYADVTIVGASAETPGGPLLVVVNHPNALVDVLVAARAVPRRLTFTAKATLFSSVTSRTLLTWVGVIPLQRAADAGSETGQPDPSRNTEAFGSITRVLRRGGAILVFPEGRSHDEPAMAQLRTGTARMALNAEGGPAVPGLRILPIGLVFERKDAPRSRILAVVGEPLPLDDWRPTDPARAVAELTDEIERRLRDLTLNYGTVEEAAVNARLSAQLAALLRYDAPPISSAGDLRDQTAIARLLPAIRTAIDGGPAELSARAVAFQTDLGKLQATLDSHHVSLDDLAISRGIKEGARFVVRELLVLAVAGPIAAWGWLNHVIPFRAAITMGRRRHSDATVPAMRTMVAGAAFVLMVYMLQGAAFALLAGPWWAILYVVSLPVAADVNLRLHDRLQRARRRARTYLLFRRNPQLHDQLDSAARTLRAEGLALATATGAQSLG